MLRSTSLFKSIKHSNIWLTLYSIFGSQKVFFLSYWRPNTETTIKKNNNLKSQKTRKCNISLFMHADFCNEYCKCAVSRAKWLHRKWSWIQQISLNTKRKQGLIAIKVWSQWAEEFWWIIWAFAHFLHFDERNNFFSLKKSHFMFPCIPLTPLPPTLKTCLPVNVYIFRRTQRRVKMSDIHTFHRFTALQQQMTQTRPYRRLTKMSL